MAPRTRATLLLVVAVASTSCSRDREPSDEEARATLERARDDFATSTRRRIDRVDRAIDRIRCTDGGAPSDELAEKTQTQLAQLRDQQRLAEAELRRALAAPPEAWDTVRASAERQVEKLERDYEALLEAVDTK